MAPEQDTGSAEVTGTVPGTERADVAQGITIPFNAIKPLILPFLGFLLGSGTTSGLWVAASPPGNHEAITKIEQKVDALVEDVRSLKTSFLAERWTRKDQVDFVRQELRPELADIREQIDQLRHRLDRFPPPPP